MLNKSTYFGEKYQIFFFFNALFLLLHVPINTIVLYIKIKKTPKRQITSFHSLILNVHLVRGYMHVIFFWHKYTC